LRDRGRDKKREEKEKKKGRRVIEKRCGKR
jgi:hypothetical protein